MELPFLISNKDWQELKPKEIDALGRRHDLDPEQEKLLDVFRVIDLRVEWVCRQAVFVRNGFVILAIAFIAVNGLQVFAMAKDYFFK
jgi:hypothetical protein